MDFPQVAPQNLEAIFSQNPGMWGMAQDYMQRANQGNDLSMQHQQLANQYEQQSQPFRLAQLGLQNDTTRAQLPGVGARSSMDVRKNANEETLNPDMLKDVLGKYKSAELKRHVDDLDNVGTMFRQYASQVENGTLPGQKPADGLKARLKAAGLDNLINPEWDNLDAPTLSKTLSTIGDQIGNESTKYRSAIDLHAAKAEAAQGLADKKIAAAKELEAQKAASRLALQKAIDAAKSATGAKDPKTWEALAASAVQHAAQMGEGPEKDQAVALAQQAQAQAIALKSAGVVAGQAGKIDTPAVANLPSIQQAAPPTIAIPPKPGKVSAPAEGRIKVVAPDGRTGTISAANKEKALAAGYKLAD